MFCYIIRNFLKKCLYSAYKEIPIRKLIVCDGDSKDNTKEILIKFPRVELFVRPDIRTTGKAIQFLFSKTETDWYVLLDADIVLAPKWYDEMCKGKTKFDVIENSKRTLAFHYYTDDPEKLKNDNRPYDECHLIKKSALEKFSCDDDYMWRHVDEFIRFTVEKNGFKYGKLDSTSHVHHETPRIPYKSDNEKNYSKIIFNEPQIIILDKKKFEAIQEKNAKSIVKYLDPDFYLIKNMDYARLVGRLERKWVEKTNPKWLEKYDKVNSLSFRINFYIERHKFTNFFLRKIKKLFF